MADITESEQWDTGVYQLETTDPVQGGADGVDNLPHKHLANRTTWLKASLETVQNTVSSLGTTFALLSGSNTQRFKVAKAVNDDEAVTKAQFEENFKNIVPPGSILTFAGPGLPEGFLVCNGAELLRTVYSSLFEAIGTTYGEGDGETTFKIPDLRGLFIRGVDNGRGIDINRVLGSFQNDSFKSHQHYHRMPSTWACDGAGPVTFFSGTNRGGSGVGNYTNSIGGSETRPKNIALNYLIKY